MGRYIKSLMVVAVIFLLLLQVMSLITRLHTYAETNLQMSPLKSSISYPNHFITFSQLENNSLKNLKILIIKEGVSS